MRPNALTNLADAMRAVIDADADESAVRLLEKIDAEYESWTPAKMLSVANVCVLLAKGTRDNALLCRALKEQANALREMGDHAAALRVLAAADDAAAISYNPRFQHATVTFARAAVLFHMGHYEPALTMLEAARTVFLAHRDNARVARVTAYSIAILYHMGHNEAVLHEWQARLADAISQKDNVQIARMHGNVGLAHARLGNVTAAKLHFSIAAAHYRRLNFLKDRAKMVRCMGRIEIVEHGAAGLPAMLRAREEFVKLGMAGEIVATDVDAIAALTENDPDADVTELCRRVVREATALGMRPDAINALARLETASRNRGITPDMVTAIDRLLAASTAGEEGTIQ